MVNIYCRQIFGQRIDEMLTNPSQSETSVVYAFGTESTFGGTLKVERVKLDWSTFIVAKILDNELTKC